MTSAESVLRERIENDARLVVNRSKTQVYSPNGNYAGMPQAFQIGTITQPRSQEKTDYRQ